MRQRAAPLVFAICDMADIPPGTAKGFRLLKREEDGEARPFAMIVVRTFDNRYFGYANRCPHTGVWLNIRNGEYLSETGDALMCSRHGARFDFETGQCLEGPCAGEILQSYPVVAFAGDVCVLGLDLVDADEDDPPTDWDETLDITIQPD